MTHKLINTDPKSVIDFINITYPQYCGLCYYDIDSRSLKSESPFVSFYFDPWHGVLEIKEHGNN